MWDIFRKKIYLIPAHNIESYLKQQLQKIITKWEIAVMRY